MQTMPSKLTGLTRKGRVFWIRVRIPSDIRGYQTLDSEH